MPTQRAEPAIWLPGARALRAQAPSRFTPGNGSVLKAALPGQGI